MVKEFVKAWEVNKPRLSAYFAARPQSDYDTYGKIWQAVITEVLNPKMDEWDRLAANKVKVIDDGDYQGTFILVTPKDIYQPTETDYVVTFVDYGSCSGCDVLQDIQSSNYDDDYDYLGKPSNQQIADYLTLSLHMLQRAKWLYTREEEDAENV